MWIASEEGVVLAPSMLKDGQVSQKLLFNGTLTVRTQVENNGNTLITLVGVDMGERGPVCRLKAQGQGSDECRLVISVRPISRGTN